MPVTRWASHIRRLKRAIGAPPRRAQPDATIQPTYPARRQLSSNASGRRSVRAQAQFVSSLGGKDSGIIPTMSTSAGENRTALVVEDDEDMRSLIELTLSTQGFDVMAVESGLAGSRRSRTTTPTSVTLDLGLPGIDGIEACRRIREISDAYVVMITSRDDEVERLIGLETEPTTSCPSRSARASSRPGSTRCSVALGAARSPPRRPGERRVALARLPARDPAPRRPDRRRRRTSGLPGGRGLSLTRTEFDLLTELMRTPARVWTREALLRSVWDTVGRRTRWVKTMATWRADRRYSAGLAVARPRVGRIELSLTWSRWAVDPSRSCPRGSRSSAYHQPPWPVRIRALDS